MHIFRGISIAFSALQYNKLRSVLTILGILIGVASVLAMIGVGDGAKTIVLEEALKQEGLNQFSMYCVNLKRVGDVWVANRSNEYFTYEDVLTIEARCPSVRLTVPRIPAWGGVLAQGPVGTETRTGYNGVNASFAEAMDWDIQEGRFITDDDIENGAKVCVLGAEVASDLFGWTSPIGKEIKIARGAGNNREKERLTVVGTMMPRQQYLQFGFSLSAQVFIPITTTQTRFTGSDRIQMLSI
ncbi:MAG: ABC transporter permease [Candidatus Poribacteria bacterium]|nr:ABC transporter permease [Candidatus Poribacteria bacterium]